MIKPIIFRLLLPKNPIMCSSWMNMSMSGGRTGHDVMTTHRARLVRDLFTFFPHMPSLASSSYWGFMNSVASFFLSVTQYNIDIVSPFSGPPSFPPPLPPSQAPPWLPAKSQRPILCAIHGHNEALPPLPGMGDHRPSLQRSLPSTGSMGKPYSVR